MVLHVIHHLFTSKQYVQCVFEVVGIVSYWHSVVSFEFFDLELRCRDLVVEALANGSVGQKNVEEFFHGQHARAWPSGTTAASSGRSNWR